MSPSVPLVRVEQGQPIMSRVKVKKGSVWLHLVFYVLMTGSDVVLKRNTVGPIFHLSDESLQVSRVFFLGVLTTNIDKI